MKLLLRVLCVAVGLALCSGNFAHAENDPMIERPRMVVQTSQSNTTSVAISPDGKTLASGSADATVKIYDVASGLELRTLIGGTTDSIAFSPDGKTLVSASTHCDVTLWEVASGRKVRTFARPPIAVSSDRKIDFEEDSVAFSPDGKTLASGCGFLVMNQENFVLDRGQTLVLWDVASGRELRALAGQNAEVRAVAFSPDGKTLASASADRAVKLWDVTSGRELRTLTAHSDKLNSVTFSPDGKTLASGGDLNREFYNPGQRKQWLDETTVQLWDVASGRELYAVNGQSSKSVAFSPDGKLLASASGDHTVRLWSAASAKELRTLAGHIDAVNSVAFLPDGKTLASGSEDRTVKLWEVASGRELRTITGHSREIDSVAFSPNGKTLAAAGQDNTVKLWHLASGQSPRTLSGHKRAVYSVAFSTDGNTLASGSEDGSVRIWAVASGQELLKLGDDDGSDAIYSVAFSPDAKVLASGGYSDAVRLWDVAGGRELRKLEGRHPDIASIAFSSDGKTMALGKGSFGQAVGLWDVSSGKMSRELVGPTDSTVFDRHDAVAFSPDGKKLALGGDYNTVQLWDVVSGQVLRTFSGYASLGSVAFSPDGKTLALGGDEDTVKLWDVASGRELHTLRGHLGGIVSVAFSPDGTTLASGSFDTTVKLWRVVDGALLGTLTSFDDGTWAVTDSEGRYDASNAGNNANLHWVVGRTPIALEQLKDRYYEPDLLAKILGYNPEPLRSVPKFGDAFAHLFPEVQAQLDSAHPLQLLITLSDQGGGYGKVRVRLNGKEITSDARNGTQLHGQTVTLKQRLIANSLMATDNIVDVVAWNADGNLSSPTVTVKLERERGARAIEGTPAAKSERPTLYAIVMGVAHFREPSMNLAFSGKDAFNFAQAIMLGASRFFGADKVHVHLLSDYEDQETPSGGLQLTAQAPTRENLRSAFTEVAEVAKPDDILVVFLAGHGVMSGGADGDYYYLTNDAQGLDLSDPAVRKLWGVSSTELTEWIKQIHSNKQMMVLDTCASGGALQKLTQQRAVPSSQIIALDRLKDRTGFYVLAGAAADRSSYETTRFGQGLLTRALLTGMKGAALRDGEFVDVAHLFQYARDEVPKLAREIGGIQTPLLAAPSADSFDVGEMLENDKRALPLASEREMMLRGVFQDEDQMADLIKLTTRFNQRLRAENDVAVRGQLAFVDADEFPDAWRVAGRYRQTRQGLLVNARLFRNSEAKGNLQLILKGNDDEQVEQLFAAVIGRVRRTSIH